MTGVSQARADRIVGLIEKAGRPLSVVALADAFYADDPDGGPLGAEAVMRVSILHMRRRGDDRARTTRAGYVLSTWPDRIEWHQARRVWDGPMLDYVERLVRQGLTHATIAERLGKRPDGIAVALSKAGRTNSTQKRVA